jgi:trans-aconitate methyltransferase
VSEARYRNFGHYISEGWNATPKQTFQRLAGIVAQARGDAFHGNLLDLGCATGELLSYLCSRFPGSHASGVDLFDPLLEEGRKLVASATFVKASVLDLPPALHGSFDLVTAVGVMSVFDENDIHAFWRNVLAATRDDGLAIVLSPLNEYGVDTMIRHRKRAAGRPLAWETGWNMHAIESIAEIVASLGRKVRFERFVFDGELARREDPVRTWTLPTADNPRQLTNGLKLLVDPYFMIVDARER